MPMQRMEVKIVLSTWMAVFAVLGALLFLAR